MLALMGVGVGRLAGQCQGWLVACRKMPENLLSAR